MSNGSENDVKSCEEMLREVNEDLKVQKLTKVEIAKRTGFSRQTISKILSSNNYMTTKQARAFASAFGYNPKFLEKGKGELKDKHITLEYSSEGDDYFEDNGYPIDTGNIETIKSNDLNNYYEFLFATQDDARGYDDFIFDCLSEIALILRDGDLYTISQNIVILIDPERFFKFDKYNDKEKKGNAIDDIRQNAFLNIKKSLARFKAKHAKDFISNK